MKFRTKAAFAAALFFADALLLALPVMKTGYRQRDAGLSAVSSPEREEGTRSSGVLAGESLKDAGFLALTFDDGPDPVYTGPLLDGLKERNVRATFFLSGERISGNEELVRRMAEEGHLIGVHCLNHTDLTKEPLKKALSDISLVRSRIGEITGVRPEYMRPPFGKISDGLFESLDMEIALWSVDSLDWKLQDAGKITERVLRDVRDGDIILMHDEFDASLKAAFEIIDKMKEKGYTFVTVDEIQIE